MPLPRASKGERLSLGADYWPSLCR
jgi:hypothetical protein